MTHQSPDALTAEWRTGRHVGRTVYAQTGPDATRSDVLIGTMDTAELAQAAVDAHNASLGAEATLAEARQAAGAEAGRAAALEAVYRQTRAERDARSAEIEKLGAQLAEARAELDTKSVVHDCCEEVVELKKDRAHLKDGLAEAVRERDEARAQLAEARELARRWQRDAHKHREIADSRPGLTQIERAEIRQAATEIEQCSRQLVAEIGPDPAEHGRAVPNSTTYCCICGQPAPAGADVCSDECRTTLGDRENACAELTAALGDDDFEALVGRVLAQTVYPEPHVNALITEARRARAKAAAAAADAERATADITTARARLAIAERERDDARAEIDRQRHEREKYTERWSALDLQRTTALELHNEAFCEICNTEGPCETRSTLVGDPDPDLTGWFIQRDGRNRVALSHDVEPTRKLMWGSEIPLHHIVTHIAETDGPPTFEEDDDEPALIEDADA